MNPFGLAIAWCALQVSLFLTLAAGVYLGVRRLQPRAGTALAMSSLVLVLGLSALAASPWPRWSWERVSLAATTAAEVGNSTATANRGVGGEAASDSSAPGFAAGDAPAVPPAQLSWFAAIAQALQFNEPAALGGEPARGWHWTSVVVALALGGMGIGLARLAGGLVAVQRLVGRSLPIHNAGLAAQVVRLRMALKVRDPIQVCESEEVKTPVTIGWRRPAILLPSTWPTWSAAERQSVLAHELSHIARQDFAAWLVARLAVALHFYHPLVHWFARRLHLDQELAADAAAARVLGNREAYLHALAKLALATPTYQMAGPVRTFIPSRSLLLRRVEMLRTGDVMRPVSAVRARVARWSSLVVLAALAVGAAGLRQSSRAAQPAPLAPQASAQPAQAGAADEPGGSPRYDFSYVPDDFAALIALRPADFAASPRLKPLADFFEQVSRPQIPARQLAQVTLVIPVRPRDERGNVVSGSDGELTVVRSMQPLDFRSLLEATYGALRSEQLNGREFLTTGSEPGPLAFWAVNDSTLISQSRRGLEQVLRDADAARPPAAAAQWQATAAGPLFATINADALRALVPPNDLVSQIFAPVLNATTRIEVTVEDAEPLVIRAMATCRTADDVKVVRQTLESALVLLRNLLPAQKARLAAGAAPHAPAGPADAQAVQQAMKLYDAATAVLNSVEMTASGSVLTITARVDNAENLIDNLLAPAFIAAREAASRARSANNMKQLGLAVHLFADVKGSMPPAVVYGPSIDSALNPTGNNAPPDVGRSWRVELLPYLEQAELYKQYRLDQAWDSEANLKVLAQMPEIFRAPEDALGSTNASYFAVTGPGTAFAGRDGTKFSEITDGTSNTLMFVEAKRPIPWTKPQDVAFDADQGLTQWGGWRAQLLVGMCDGSVTTLMPTVDAAMVRRWVLMSDGEAVQSPWEMQHPNPAAPR